MLERRNVALASGEVARSSAGDGKAHHRAALARIIILFLTHLATLQDPYSVLIVQNLCADVIPNWAARSFAKAGGE
jgi:hypothetical protein